MIKISSHGGNLALAARKYGLSEKDFIDFSANINPLGPAPGVYEAIAKELWRIKHYPDPDCGELPLLLADYLGVGKENLLIGNGAAELIYALPKALKIKKALMLVPTFGEYAEAVMASGGKVSSLSLAVGTSSLCLYGEIRNHLSGADAFFLCNPNNPTGEVIAHASLLPVLAHAEKEGITVIIDEAFMDFVQDKENFSLVSMACRRRNLVVLYSMTKFFGIPGLRLGAAVAVPEVINNIKKIKDPWSVNTMAIVAGVAALRDKKHMAETARVVREEKEYLFNTLSSIPSIRTLPSAANFILLDISGTGMASAELVERMAGLGILVRNCDNFEGLGTRFIRVAVRAREENEYLLHTLRKVIGSYKTR